MRYQMTQNLISLGDDGVIYDEQGNPIYQVDARFFNIPAHIDVKDPDGNIRATLNQKLLSLHKSMTVTIDGEEVAEVVRKLMTFRMSFDIRLTSGDLWKLQGGWSGWSDYSFTLTSENGDTVAEISREWVTLANTYGIDIADGQNDLLVLCVIIALESAENDDESAG